ncbi:MAG: hypothetical protein ACAF41_07805 [Leptolyngbya sp. BL-A-14]
MKERLKQIIRKVLPLAFLDPEGDEGIIKRGHRDYVGGMWEEIGTLQFEFLLLKGLKPNSYLLDIACGSLRLGVKAIPYLEPSHYLGIEKEKGLVQAGLEEELDPEVREQKQPKIVISDSFEFEKLGQKADFAIAQSLFTHLPPRLIHLCFKKLHPWLENDGVFYATFFETEQKINNPNKPHDHGYFAYSQAEMCGFGETNGFVSHYIGNWNHPRNQVIIEYRKC